MCRICLVSAVVLACAHPAGVAAENAIAAVDNSGYAVLDPELKLVEVDTSETESFLAVRTDTTGRLFVGGREALFVYEVGEHGRYEPRRELYRFPNHTWIYDIEIRGDDVYVSTVSALYRLPGARTNREGITAERIVWGVPMGHVHQCYHALVWGPEGDLYFSQGDPLWYYGDFSRPDHWGHWPMFFQPEGSSLPYTGVGAVFRVRPDGSELRSFSRGLRNSCGLVFDRSWNLFTNDNDHEQMPAFYAPGRLQHVTEHSYFTWPRGWLVSKTPDRADLLQTVNEEMGRAVPVLQTYYADGYLPEKHDNNLLVTRWGRRTVSRFPLEKNGATFTAKEHVLLQGEGEARPVGICVGRGGRVFVTICYMSQNEGSPTYRSDVVMITRADDAGDSPFDGYDAPSAEPERLWSELSNSGWWRRYAAHVEILRRGGGLLTEAAARLKGVDAKDPAVRHLPWLAAAAGTKEAVLEVAPLLEHDDADVRVQAIRALAHVERHKPSRAVFERALADEDPQVRQAAVLALFDFEGPVPEAVVKGPARGKDTYLRQAATLLLAEKAPFDELVRLCRAEDAATRLAGVLAAGFRLTVPPVFEPIPERLPLDAHRSEEAYIIQFDDAKVDLRQFGRIGNFTVAEHWKAGPHTAEQERLFELLATMLDDGSEQVRLQAAHFLYMLNDPRTETRIAAVIRDVQDERLSIQRSQGVLEVWMAGPFPDGDEGFKTVHPPEAGAVDLTAKYEVDGRTIEWTKRKPNGRGYGAFYDLDAFFGPMDRSSVYSLFRLETATPQRVQLMLASDDGIKVWRNGRVVWENDVLRPTLQFDDVVAVDLQPGSNDILVRVRNRTDNSGQYLDFRSLGEVQLTLPEKVEGLSLAERLKTAGTESQPVDPKFLEIDWEQEVRAGDSERGRRLYSGEALGCAKCHAATPLQGGNAGPSLADAGRRFTVPYLVESVLAPNVRISPVFRSTTLVTSDGKVVTGLLVNETAEQIELLLPDTKKTTIAKSAVEERKLTDISAMPQGLVKTPEELRDVLAYLLTNPAGP